MQSNDLSSRPERRDQGVAELYGPWVPDLPTVVRDDRGRRVIPAEAVRPLSQGLGVAGLYGP